jgi:hypothetical protein
MEALAPRRARARLDRELIVRSETCNADVMSRTVFLSLGEDAPLSDFRVVLGVATAADALDVHASTLML